MELVRGSRQSQSGQPSIFGKPARKFGLVLRLRLLPAPGCFPTSFVRSSRLAWVGRVVVGLDRLLLFRCKAQDARGCSALRPPVVSDEETHPGGNQQTSLEDFGLLQKALPTKRFPQTSTAASIKKNRGQW